MRENRATSKVTAALISVMLMVASGYSVAADIAPTTTTTTSTSLTPLIQPKPAGTATSIKLPPVSTTIQNITTTSGLTPQRTTRTGPEGKAIVDARYDLDLPVCPVNNSLCPDINNKCSRPEGDCRDLKKPISDTANYNKCPETCRVSRVTTGWNSYRNAPETSVEAVCPAGYATLAAYNLADEYKTAVGAGEQQLPWPITAGGPAENYRTYFYDSANYRCGVANAYVFGYCEQGTGIAQRNATPLNFTLGVVMSTWHGWVSASYDYGYTNYGADQSYNPSVSDNCYASGCYSAKPKYLTWCDWSGNPAGCNAYNWDYLYGWGGWSCSDWQSPTCLGADPWGNCHTYGCNPVCTGSDYYWKTRAVYPNICWYRGGKLIPGAGKIPTSLVCGRIKPSWK